MQRKLAVILAADVAGYSRLMAADEEGTRATLTAYRAAIGEIVAEHDGRIFGTSGDSVICDFASPVQAVRASVAMQRGLQRRNADLPEQRRMEFRIGLNLGDVMIDEHDLLGDAVNIAARLQEVAAPAGICISDAVRMQIDGKLNFAVVSLGERSLKNIPKSVPVFRVDWKLEDPAASGVLGGALALPDKPSIAVLPFANMSGDAEQEYFADGITEDIITALARYRWFFVIARNSTFTYKGRAVDIKQVARELGVRYVLEGSVRKAGSRIRVTAQLIEAETGNHLWAEKYDRNYADVFDIQDELTESVVGAIEPEILLGESRRATGKSIDNLDAFDCCARGIWHFYQFGADDNRQGELLLRRAIELDPKMARAHMGLARLLFGRCWWGWSDDIKRDAASAYHSAQLAVTLDDRDPYGHYIAAMSGLLLQRHQQCLAEAQRAIDLSPNFALGFLGLTLARIFIGHFEGALDPALRGMRLSPNDPLTFEFINSIALAHYQMGNYDEALHHIERGLRSRRTYGGLRTLLATLGQLGRNDEAITALAEMERIKPGDAQAHWRATTGYADPAHRQHLIEGLRKAGMTNPGLANPGLANPDMTGG
ncbi:MAG: adenylate/guanylate cyclase domain-containing protein [Rhodospirillales bacterium]